MYAVIEWESQECFKLHVTYIHCNLFDIINGIMTIDFGYSMFLYPKFLAPLLFSTNAFLLLKNISFFFNDLFLI